MDEKDEKSFSWASCFFVTGVCLIIFSLLMHLLDGVSLKLFMNAGMVSLGLGIISFLGGWLNLKIIAAKQKELSVPQEQAA
jgi:uncharacterized membrane protein YgdD (TMEM256/DUF423 family)